MAFEWKGTEKPKKIKKEKKLIKETKKIESKNIFFCATDSPGCPRPLEEDLQPTKKSHIYLDYNATTPIDKKVLSILTNKLENSANTSSAHYKGRVSKEELEKFRLSIMDKLGLNSGKLIFFSSGTEANNLVMKSFEGSKGLYSTTDHSSITAMGKNIKSFKAFTPYSNGKLSTSDLSEKLTNQTSFVTLAYASNETGVIHKLDDYIKTIKDKAPDCFIHSDYCQVIGKTKYELHKDVDSITISAHKLGGPIGIAALWVKDESVLIPMLHGGNQEFSIKPGTVSLPLVAAFDMSIKQSLKNNLSDMNTKRNYLIKEIKSLDCLIVGEDISRVANTVSFIYPKKFSNLVKLLSEQGIFVSEGSACNSFSGKPSPSLISLGFSKDQAKRSIRVSFGPSTTKPDLEEFVIRLSEILK